VANSLSCSLGAVALAWAERKGVIPVIGPRTHTQLLDNLTAQDVVLSDDVMRQLDEASALAPTYPHDILAPQRQQMGLVAAQSGGSPNQAADVEHEQQTGRLIAHPGRPYRAMSVGMVPMIAIPVAAFTRPRAMILGRSP